MTVSFSNRSYNVLKAFMQKSGHRGLMNREDFVLLDQRITSGLGRRKVPFVIRTGDVFQLTPEAIEAFNEFESTDIYRHFANTSIAKCFDVSRRGMSVVRNGHRRKIKAA